MGRGWGLGSYCSACGELGWASKPWMRRPGHQDPGPDAKRGGGKGISCTTIRFPRPGLAAEARKGGAEASTPFLTAPPHHHLRGSFSVWSLWLDSKKDFLPEGGLRLF